MEAKITGEVCEWSLKEWTKNCRAQAKPPPPSLPAHMRSTHSIPSQPSPIPIYTQSIASRTVGNCGTGELRELAECRSTEPTPPEPAPPQPTKPDRDLRNCGTGELGKVATHNSTEPTPPQQPTPPKPTPTSTEPASALTKMMREQVQHITEERKDPNALLTYDILPVTPAVQKLHTEEVLSDKGVAGTLTPKLLGVRSPVLIRIRFSQDGIGCMGPASARFAAAYL